MDDEAVRARIERLERCSKKLFDAALMALGAYDALKTIGAHEHLPGYDRCVEQTQQAIDAYKERWLDV